MAIVASSEAGQRAIQKEATILQLRAPDATAREMEIEAARLIGSTRVPVVVSSRCDIAVACGAAGVNLPERDISVHDARALMRQRLVGRSVHSVEAALRAQLEGADYVIFGPVWESASHAQGTPAGVDALARVAAAVHIPVLAIGGVTKQRVGQCIDGGAAGYAAIRMFA